MKTINAFSFTQVAVEGGRPALKEGEQFCESRNGRVSSKISFLPRSGIRLGRKIKNFVWNFTSVYCQQ